MRPNVDTAMAKVASAPHPSYRVCMHSREGHVVLFPQKGRTSDVLFEAWAKLPAGILRQADTSCLVMTEIRRDTLFLAVSQPDLALYRGPSDEAFDADSKRIERSTYRVRGSTAPARKSRSL